MPGEYSQEALRAHFEDTNRRLAAIEEQLRLLSEKAGVAYDAPLDGVPDEVRQLAADGDRMGAMRKYRELTGGTADQARDAVAGL
jgi:hypothetical protein